MDVTCPACASSAARLFTTKDYDYRVSDEIFVYYECSRCHLIFLFPIPGDLARYYTSDYYDIPKSSDDLATKATVERYRLDLIQSVAPPRGRFLEIGPSYGALTYLAKQVGYDVDAIEMDAACCEFLERVVGIRVVHSDQPVDTLRGMGIYDVIALWHVIEHLENPHLVVAALAEHLAAGGVVAIAAPNPDALQFKFWQSRWLNIHAPRHLTLIPMELLERWMHSAGLKMVVSTTTDPGSIGLNWLGWHRSAMNLSTSPWLRKLLGIMGKIVNKLLIPVERRNDHGSGYVMIFQKPEG